MEEQSTQQTQGMSQLKLASIIITTIVVLAGLAGGVIYFGVNSLVETFEEEMLDEFANSPPPSFPDAALVVDAGQFILHR